jgi:predicted Rossmann fold flavoprotein
MNFFADIAIIGGGAAGLCAAITAKRLSPKSEVYIFEALDRVGKKLIITGNGRCNITNKNLTRFHGEDSGFSRYALEKVGNHGIGDFFQSIGVPFIFEGDKAYPASLQASSVVDCLRFECDRLGVHTVCGARVTDIKFGKDFTLSFEDGFARAKSVICCTGLYSGGEKMGSDGGFFRLLKEKGFKTVRLSPSIVQIKTETDYVKQLKGIKIDAVATLLCGSKILAEEYGEVLFCDYGLSGPAILNIAREAFRKEDNFTVSLDLYPDLSVNALYNMLLKRSKFLSSRTLEDFFTGMLNKRLGQVVLKYCGHTLSESVGTLSPEQCLNIAAKLKNFSFKVLGNTGFINSQVTAGGISTDEFYNDSLMSKKYRGLFACGELLDVDGDCGGFNLAWAWSSGIIAATNAVNYIGDL